MDPVDAIKILARRWWVVLLTVSITLSLVVLGSLSLPPIYTASTTLRAATGVGTSILSLDFRYAERLANTYVEITRSRPLLESTIATLDLNLSVEDINEVINVRLVPDTELIEINVENGDPNLAAIIANTLGEALIENAKKLYAAGGRSAPEVFSEKLWETEEELTQLRSERDTLLRDPEIQQSAIEAKDRAIELKEQSRAFLLTQIQMAWMTEALRANAISFVERAVPPTKPSRPRILLNGVMGLAAGLLGGMALVFVFEKINPVVYGRKQLESMTDIPVLATIPRQRGVSGGQKKGIVILTKHQPQASRAYHLLGANLQSICIEQNLSSILVTSARSEDRKSEVVANLGAVTAEAGLRVIVVDSDFRQPKLHRILLGLTHNPRGLSEMLKSIGVDRFPLRAGPISGLRVLPSGNALSNPTNLISLPIFRKLVDELKQNSDIVFYDAAPVLMAPDASIVASALDGVLLVISRGKTTQESVRATLDQLKLVHAVIVGFVVT